MELDSNTLFSAPSCHSHECLQSRLKSSASLWKGSNSYLTIMRNLCIPWDCLIVTLTTFTTFHCELQAPDSGLGCMCVWCTPMACCLAQALQGTERSSEQSLNEWMAKWPKTLTNDSVMASLVSDTGLCSFRRRGSLQVKVKVEPTQNKL